MCAKLIKANHKTCLLWCIYCCGIVRYSVQDLPKSCLFSCLFSLQERGVEGEGKEFAGASLDEVDAFGTVEEYADGLVVALLGLEQYLAAGSAGCDGGGSEGAVGVGGYGKGYYRLVGVGGSGIEEGGALSAESRGVGGILLIGAGDQGAVGKQRGSAHVEVGVGGIAALGSGLGGIDELAVGGGKLVVGA